METDDLAGVRARLAAAGCPVEPAIPLATMERFYTRDPWGARIELLESRRDR